MNDKDILDKVIDKFGIADNLYYGSTYILPDGRFLDLSKYDYHSEVEKYLIEIGLSKYEYNKYLGSPTLRDLNCIRCNARKYYVMLSSQITQEQLNSLFIWIDYLSKFTKLVEVIKEDCSTFYHFSEISPKEIVNKIKEGETVK